MRSYTVHLPPGADAADQTKAETSEKLVLVADGFSPFAFLLAPIWMLVNRCWIALVVYIVAMLALELATDALDMHVLWQTLIGLGVHLIIAFEADQILRWSLNRRGFKTVAVISARDADEAEMRYLDQLSQPQPRTQVSQVPAPQTSLHPHSASVVNVPGAPTALGTN